jgi:RNase adaptor protein for sRNA GlmZ degradation
MSIVDIVSFGYLHAAPPVAHLTIDLRSHFCDPDVSPELRHLTADDESVRAAVLGTSGVRELVDATVRAVTAFADGPSAGPVVVADGCAGGRHRAPTFARELATRLLEDGHEVTMHHRDMHRPVVSR